MKLRLRYILLAEAVLAYTTAWLAGFPWWGRLLAAVLAPAYILFLGRVGFVAPPHEGDDRP